MFGEDPVRQLHDWRSERERVRERKSIEQRRETRSMARREETEESLRSRHAVPVLASSGRYRSTGVQRQVITE